MIPATFKKLSSQYVSDLIESIGFYGHRFSV